MVAPSSACSPRARPCATLATAFDLPVPKTAIFAAAGLVSFASIRRVCVWWGGGRVRKKRKKYAHSHVQNSALWSTNTAVRFTCSRGRLLGLRSAAAGTSASKPRSIRFGGLWFTIVCNFLPRVIPRFSYENWRQRRCGLVSSSVLCRVLAELYFDSYNFTGRVGVCWEKHTLVSCLRALVYQNQIVSELK